MLDVETLLWPRAIALVGLLALSAAPAAMAKVRVVQSLTPTQAAPGARGRATLALKTASKGRLRVTARGLAHKSAFDLVVGGVKVGSFVTNSAGIGKIKLSTDPKRSQALLGVDPRGKSLSVRDQNGDDQLEADVPDDSRDSASGAFACCVSHREETECEMEMPDECVARGGTTQAGVTSCIPDPCGTTPGGEHDVVCCFPGSSVGAFVDEEAESGCDETDTHECSLAGGTVIEARSCEPNPCAAVPPSVVTVCCVPDEHEAECEVVTPEHCTVAGGGALASATSCAENPCGQDRSGEGGGSDGSDGVGSED